MSHDLATARGSSDRSSRVAVLMLITSFLAPVALTTVATHAINQRNQPSDEELSENLLAHEAKFNELVEMLDSDCRNLPPAAGESIDLAGLSAVVTSAARKDTYKRRADEYPGILEIICICGGWSAATGCRAPWLQLARPRVALPDGRPAGRGILVHSLRHCDHARIFAILTGTPQCILSPGSKGVCVSPAGSIRVTASRASISARHERLARLRDLFRCSAFEHNGQQRAQIPGSIPNHAPPHRGRRVPVD
jgi:hypothetical protein